MLDWGLIIICPGHPKPQQPVPLTSVDVDAKIVDFCAEVEITQVFCSHETEQRDAV